jgi:hypothetical protein
MLKSDCCNIKSRVDFGEKRKEKEREVNKHSLD